MRTKQDFLIYSTALLSGMFSFFFFKDFLGWGEWWQKVATVGLSIVIIVAIDYCTERLISTKNRLYLFPMLLCVLTSILGTVGSFQASVEKHLAQARDRAMLLQEWQQKKEMAAAWRDAAQNSPSKWNRGWRLKQAEKQLANMDTLKVQIAGAAPAGVFAVNGFTSLAQRYKVNSGDLLFYVLIFIAVFVDYLHIQAKIDKLLPGGAVRARTPGKNKKRRRLFTAPPAAASPSPVAGGGGDPMAAKRAAREQRRQERLQKLSAYIKHYPEATLAEMAGAIGVSSRETVRKYLDELGM